MLYDNRISKMQFSGRNYFPKLPSRGVTVKIVEISKCSKVCLVGTLNFCLKMPDLSSIGSMCAEKKAKNHWKFAVLTSVRKWPIFLHILDVFSAQDDPIELKPFSLNQASRDTSLEYQQGILWSTLKFQYFWLWPPLRGP